MTSAKVMILGDLHLSDKYSGRHSDYTQNSIDAMVAIVDAVRENNITHLFFLGDLVGVGDSDKKLKTREFLVLVMQWLQELNRLTDGNVYSVRGNHDMDGSITDFDVFMSLGYIKQSGHKDIGAARFHLVNYGDEHRSLSVDKSKYNIALTHANLQINGVTTWFRAGDGVDLSALENFTGVSLVVGGHIHNPSPRLVSTAVNGQDISLFYPGNITRPKSDNTWDSCFGVMILLEDDEVSLDQYEFKLKSHEELFVKTHDEADIEDIGVNSSPIINIDELSEILAELTAYNLGGSMDYSSQIRRMAGTDKEAADLAIEYLNKIEGV